MPRRLALRGLGGCRLAQAQGILLHAHGDLGVAIGRLQADVAQPATDDIDFDARLKEVNRRGVPEHVRRNSPRRSRSRLLRIQISAQAPHALVNAEARHRLAGRSREHAVIGTRSTAIFQQLLQGLRCLVPQRARPPLAALAEQPNMRWLRQRQLIDAQARQCQETLQPPRRAAPASSYVVHA